MGYYFDDRESAAWLYGDQPEAIIRLMAAKYMGDNPAAPYVWRMWNKTGIQSNKKAGYVFDFGDRFPQGEAGETALAMGDLYCPAAKASNFIVTCQGPVALWLNGEKIFTSNGNQERSGAPVVVGARLKEGYNRFLIRCERTTIGFGCVLQNAMPQWEPCNYVLPFSGRQGAAGFLYTRPMDASVEIADAFWGEDEQATGVAWLPEETGALEAAGSFYAWTLCRPERDTLLVADGLTVAAIDGRRAEAPYALPAGEHALLLYGELRAIRAFFSGSPLPFAAPVRAHGLMENFLVLGPCAASQTPEDLARMGVVYEDATWRPARENTLLRPYVETALFGRWTYPLGVTLYGLLSAGRALDEAAYVAYVRAHVRQVTEMDELALWETARFGFAGVNQQLCWLDALDDCGSFGSLMLECDGGESPAVARIAERVGRYMLEEQPTTEDGAFRRRDNTIWADDMYMSGPFLCRYSAMTGDHAGMDFFAEQILKYKELLFMPEKGVMAHMLCLDHGKNNRIPWCRGNGWVIFSLSELLMRLPKRHARRDALEAFFRELTDGYLRLQDERGMWHQILDEHGTYPESSATAMFICAFCRGLRMGLYPENTRVTVENAVRRAWRGLTETVIDRRGNLYGVCRGSGFSFSRAYYRTLMWNFNDTHGIGIVMLAGVELLQTLGR